jgi:hypothetical protein
MTEIIERTVPAPPGRVWELWTTPEGISRWWAPEGFRTDVRRLDLAAGGELVYTMTAVGPEQVAFMEQNGMPLVTESRKYFTEVCEPTRLGYRSVVDLAAVEGGTRVQMAVEPLHDEVWTQRLVAGRVNELENLGALVAGE